MQTLFLREMCFRTLQEKYKVLHMQCADERRIQSSQGANYTDENGRESKICRG